MDEKIIAAIITLVGSIIVASLTFYLTKSKEREAEARRQRMEHYKEFLESLSGVVVSSSSITLEAQLRWQNACNTISLVASQKVLEALWNFQDAIAQNNPDKSPNLHDKRLNELVLAIRADLGVSPKDDPTLFRFRLWSAH